MQIVGCDADVETSFGENVSFIQMEDTRGCGENYYGYNIRVVEERKNREWIFAARSRRRHRP